MKISSLTSEEERQRRMEEVLRQQHGEKGVLHFYECQMCHYLELYMSDPDGPQVIQFTQMPSENQCALCVEVNTRTPEVYRWVSQVATSVLREVARVERLVQARPEESR